MRLWRFQRWGGKKWERFRLSLGGYATIRGGEGVECELFLSGVGGRRLSVL